MMEEEVPSASPRGAAASRRTGSGASYSRIAPDETNSNSNIASDHDRTPRRSMIGVYLSPSYLMSRILFLLTLSMKILALLLYPVRFVSTVIFPPGEFDNISSTDASRRAAAAFVSMFDKTYIQPVRNSGIGGDVNGGGVDDDLLVCPFREQGYSELVQDIATKAHNHQSIHNNNNSDDDRQDVDSVAPPLLLIYLHSPLHGQVPSFLSKTICNANFLALLNQHVHNGTLACWGGSIHTADGAHVQNSLQVNNFPFLALVKVQPNSSSGGNGNGDGAQRQNLELNFRMEGPSLQSISPTTLHLHLSNSLNAYQHQLSEQTLRRLQRQEEIHLRQEQDREYREALEEDRRREREKQEEAERKEEEERKAREEVERAEDSKRIKLQNARDLLGEEPNSDNNAGNRSIARIRLMLPSGKRVERKFWGDDSVNVVRAFLILHFDENGMVMNNFQLSSNYPKKALINGEATLKDEGLCPQSVIMVQDLDA